MLMVLSPSKTLDYSRSVNIKDFTQPALLKEAETLIGLLRKRTPKQIAQLMALSDKLAALNAQRYRDFSPPFTPSNARQALLAFKGDVYESMRIEAYKPPDFAFAQTHLRILSGLYGVLRPLDLMQPYRLEMGTKLATARGKDLYGFWGERIASQLNAALKEAGGPLVNLASEEYFKAVRQEVLGAPVLHLSFKEKRGDRLQTIGLLAKRARGAMADYIIRHRISEVEALRKFNENGYRFDSGLSGAGEFVFIR